MTATEVSDAPHEAERTPLLSARGVVKAFDVRGGVFGRAVGQVRAVDGVDLDVFPGETVGLVCLLYTSPSPRDS